MKRPLVCIIAILVLGFSPNVLGQSGSDKCELYVVDAVARKELMLEKFVTVIAEEELTNKSYRFHKTGLFITASVYYTDESLASEHGYDSIMLGVAVSRKPLQSAFSTRHNAFAELTLATLDTVRVKTYYTVRGRRYLIGIQCQTGKHEDIH